MQARHHRTTNTMENLHLQVKQVPNGKGEFLHPFLSFYDDDFCSVSHTGSIVNASPPYSLDQYESEQCPTTVQFSADQQNVTDWGSIADRYDVLAVSAYLCALVTSELTQKSIL